MSRFLAGVGIVVVVLLVIFIGVGWITFHKSPEKATVEIQTLQMQQAGERAVEGSRKLVEEAADSVKKAVHEERPEPATNDKPEEFTTSSPSGTNRPD